MDDQLKQRINVFIAQEQVQSAIIALGVIYPNNAYIPRDLQHTDKLESFIYELHRAINWNKLPFEEILNSNPEVFLAQALIAITTFTLDPLGQYFNDKMQTPSDWLKYDDMRQHIVDIALGRLESAIDVAQNETILPGDSQEVTINEPVNPEIEGININRIGELLNMFAQTGIISSEKTIE